MGAFRDLFRVASSVTAWAARTGGELGREIAVGRAHAASRPSVRARRAGILAPGDSPGNSAGYLDYRGIGLPREVPTGSTQVVSLGHVCHPHGGGSVPFGLDWRVLNRHTAVIAPTGSGKTVSVLAPWIANCLVAGIPVVAIDVKGDLLQEVARVARLEHPLPARVWDVFRPGGTLHAWNPLAEVADETSLQAIVTALLGDVDTNSEHRHFQERDHRWLAGLLRLVLEAVPGPTLDMVSTVLADRPTLRRLVRALPEHAIALNELTTMTDAEYGLATAGLANALAWVGHSAGREATSSSDFTIADCLKGGMTVIGARAGAGEPAQAAAAVFISSLRMRMFSSFGDRPPPLLLVLDEAARYSDRIEISPLLDLARAANVGVVLGLQNVDQIGADEGEIATRLGNCGTLIVLPGATERTARYVSSRLGQHTVDSVTYSLDSRGRYLPTRASERTDILGTREIMHPPLGQWNAIFHSQSIHEKPLLLDLTRRDLRESPSDVDGLFDFGTSTRDTSAPTEHAERADGRARIKGKGLMIGEASLKEGRTGPEGPSERRRSTATERSRLKGALAPREERPDT